MVIKPRLVILDVMLGIAMLLVVLGHHLLPIMPDWYHDMHYYIYTFHIPLFIFLSGFLISYSYRDISYKTYVWRKFIKFFPAYFLVGTLCIVLGNPHIGVPVLLKEIAILLISPKDCEAVFLWYIYLLMIYYVISPSIIRIVRGKWFPFLFVCSLGLSFMGVRISYFCIDYFCQFTPYYLAGMVCAEHIQKIKIKWGWAIIPLLLFVLLSITHFYVGYSPLLEYSLSWLGIPTVYSVASILRHSRLIRQVLVFISKNCYGIYLLHMFFVQGIYLLAKDVLGQFSSTEAIVYLMFSVSLSILFASLSWKTINATMSVRVSK